ncbi:MAG: hypothetical protein IKW00_00935 [Clostridia bacterium]|nr:hypothetical protein [Clostridia bacterium]
MAFSVDHPWIAEREATICTWKADYNRGFISNMNVSLLSDFLTMSARQIEDYVLMMKHCGFTGIQVTDMVAAWRACGSWEAVHDRYKTLARALHNNGMKFTVWCWAAEFSGHGWHDDEAVYENADPAKPACEDGRVRAFFSKYYDIYADLAPHADRVIAHFFDPGRLKDTQSILYFTRLLADKFRQINPCVQIAVDTWGCPEDYPAELVAAGLQDIMLMELPFLPTWRQEGKRAAFRKGVKTLGCGLGSWGWYTCEYEIDQFPFMCVNNRVLKDVYHQTRLQGDSVLAPTYWSEMDSYHVLNFFSMYAAGHLLIDPDADPDQLLAESAEAITGKMHPQNKARLLQALELIRDARSGDTWRSYWWQEEDYILLHGDFSDILRRADKCIRDFEQLLTEDEPSDGISFPISRRHLYRLMLPHLYQIRQFSWFRQVLSDLMQRCAAGMTQEEMQNAANALPYEIPEYNCVIGLWGQPEARIAYQMVCDFCRSHGLSAPDRGHMRFVFKRRLYDALCTRQRGLNAPVYVSPRFYEGGKALGEEYTASLLEEMAAEGVLIRREDGRFALKNWADFRFDFNI